MSPRGWPDHQRRMTGADTYHQISAASTNADTVKASPGVVVGYYISNRASSFRAVKLYNKASDPTVGTDVPQVTLDIPANSAANVTLNYPIEFEDGIAIAMTTGNADNNAGAVALNDLAVNIYYI